MWERDKFLFVSEVATYVVLFVIVLILGKLMQNVVLNKLPENVILKSLKILWKKHNFSSGLCNNISLGFTIVLVLHAPFLQQFLPKLKQATALPIYLETGGHRPQQLSLILDHLDCIGMDMKLPSVSGEKRWEAHADFLRRCVPHKEVFVKVIVCDQTREEDLVTARKIIAEVSHDIPVILQPVTPIAGEAMTPPRAEQVLWWQQQMKQSLSTVRVIPQTHKMIGQL